MRARQGRQMRAMATYSPEGTMGKTFFGKLISGAGKVLHDVGATVLKAHVQPFKSFSNTEKYDKIFNPTMQTGAFKTLNKGIDVLDTVGHVAGKAFTNIVTQGLVNVKSKTPTPKVEDTAGGALDASPKASASASSQVSPQDILDQLGRNKAIRKLTFDFDSFSKLLQ